MITAVILAKNEEIHLKELIPTLSFCDEVIVVDNDSTDKTAEVAKKLGARVLHSSSVRFSELRSLATKAAKNTWLLHIDADERVSTQLQKEICEAVQSEKYAAYAIPRIDIFWGKNVLYGETLGARLKGIIRLVHRDAGQWNGDVHEVFTTKKPVGKLQNHLVHYSHKGIEDFLQTVNTFSTKRADELYKKGVRLWGLHIIFPPFMKFLYTFIILGGFLDGARGFVYSFMMSFHSFLSRSKLYLLHNR